jgi:hypothetical protein
MLHAVFEVFLEIVLELLGSLFWWIVLFPVVWVVSLPFILVLALSRRERYGVAIGEMLVSVHDFWAEMGPALFI